VLYSELVEPGLLPLQTLLARLSSGPARIFGLERPRIAAGARANVVLLDLAGVTRVTENGFRSRSTNSWLLGRALKSRVAMTVANGVLVHE
jgi:dihydroorotase